MSSLKSDQVSYYELNVMSSFKQAQLLASSKQHQKDPLLDETV